MANTIVIQSHRSPLPLPWLQRCMNSVAVWAATNNYDYRFLGDELFDEIPPEIMKKTASQKVIATDLGRLKVLQSLLKEGYQTVVWCDADFLVFSPRQFRLPDEKSVPENYALGREVWIQRVDNDQDKFKSYTKVHNAFMLFRQGNSFLDFYCEHAERLLNKLSGSVPPQFIGPKLLTALHNVVQCPVVESAGMLSPVVLKNIHDGEGKALTLFKQKSPEPIYAANLCSSLVGEEQVGNQEMDKIITRLIRGGIR